METSEHRPRCPYAVQGVDSTEMRRCPGFSPQRVPIGADRIVGTGTSCLHLSGQRDPRRRGAYVSACMHPLLGATPDTEPRVTAV